MESYTRRSNLRPTSIATSAKALLALMSLSVMAACGGSSNALPSPSATPSSTRHSPSPAPTTIPTNSAPGTPVPPNTATSNWVTLSGDRTGSLTHLAPLCFNQFQGVQTQGTLNGLEYDLVLGDPTNLVTGGNIVLYKRIPNALNWLSVWMGGTPGITSYSFGTGATFDATLQPNPANDDKAPLRVTGAILCSAGRG
jgi:hypothetical protein